jgi:MFS family permease
MPETPPAAAPIAAGPPSGQETTRLRDLSAHQWKSGIAAWLGWLFDGLDMHLYTLVAAPFVAQLLIVEDHDPRVNWWGSVIQAAFMIGWALGGGFFGRIGDRLGRTRALMLTILTYAIFTGLSFFAQNEWHLLICRFLAALGIGGEWAVGAALLSETWPRKWRPWIAASLQSAVNIGVLLAMAAAAAMAMIKYADKYYQYRTVFLVGVLPALLVLWIRRAVPETEEWHAAKAKAGQSQPQVRDLFRGDVLRTTVLTIAVCSLSLSAHWAFMYWFPQHLHSLLRNLPADMGWDSDRITQFKAAAMALLMVASIAGNFVAGGVAKALGYRRAIVFMCLAYFACMVWTYSTARTHEQLFWHLIPLGICQGLFGLFTMYLPPLFPTLLRTTGAGFCYNIGRIASAGAIVAFGMFSLIGDQRPALLYSSFLFLPAAAVAMLLWEPPDESAAVGPAAVEPVE